MSLKKPIPRALGLAAGYIISFWLVRLVYLTLVTYSFVRSPTTTALQKIGDVVRANQVLTYGFSALVFVTILQILQPLTRTQFKQVFNSVRLRESFAPNALNGSILATVLIAGSTLGGHMSYLGVYMKFDEVAFSLGSALLFTAAMFVTVVVEEYIMREVLEREFRRKLGVLATMVCSSFIYLLVKWIQFDLSWIEIANLLLLNLTLSMIARNEHSYMASASFCAAFLTIVHVLFGLPYMGQDMPGLLLLRAPGDDGLGSLLSGGTTGPESGIVLAVLLVIYLYLPQIRSKKIEV